MVKSKTPDIASLRKEEKALRSLEKQIRKMPDGLFSAARKKRKERQYRHRNDAQTKACASWLRDNDADYRKLTDQVYRLLSRERITFVVYNSPGANFDDHGTRFKGSVHKNGYIYVDSDTDMFFGDGRAMMPNQYPATFKGRIDYLGRIELEAVRFDTLHSGYRPDRYRGSIDNDGQILLEAIPLDESQTEGELFTGRLMADLFGHSPMRLALFIKARGVIVGLISKFRTELVARDDIS